MKTDNDCIDILSNAVKDICYDITKHPTRNNFNRLTYCLDFIKDRMYEITDINSKGNLRRVK